MTSILSRYLARGFLKVFCLSSLSFIAVLLVMRLEEIARFASTGSSIIYVLLFTTLQIPHILPLAIPISSLIASFFLMHTMSSSQELTSLRAAGISLGQIQRTLIWFGIFFMGISLLISSELTPYTRAKSKELILKMTTTNPLVLLQKDPLIKLKGVHLEMQSSTLSDKASDVLFVLKNTSTKRLGLMIAKELDVRGEDLQGKHVTFISSLDPKSDRHFDHLIIENQAEMTTATANFSQILEDAKWQIHEDYLPLRLLFAKEIIEKGGVFKKIGKPHLELAKRLSLALASLTFTMMGLSFGLKIGRHDHKKGAVYAAILTIVFLVLFNAAKALKSQPCTAIALYLLPHVLIVCACCFVSNKVSRGVES